jgi:NAD(P)H dehydrogenase (quinone)
VAQKWDFVTTSGHHYNYMLEQKHAADLDLAFSPDILAEIQKLQVAELLILVTPIWWSSVPAILKGWLDRILVMGVAWDGGRIYEQGLMRGKQAMVIATAGSPADFFRPEGRYGATPAQMLHSVNHGTLAFCGISVHEPFVKLNVLGSSRTELEAGLRELEYRLQHLLDSPQWLIRF